MIASLHFTDGRHMIIRCRPTPKVLVPRAIGPGAFHGDFHELHLIHAGGWAFIYQEAA